MSHYYKYLFEEEKEMTIDNFQESNFERLSTNEQIKFLEFFFKKFEIPARILPSDNFYKKFYIEFQSEHLKEEAVKKFSSISGMMPHGDSFESNEAVYIFTYNYNVRSPLNGDGSNQWDNKEDKWLRRANQIRRYSNLGNRLFNMLTKPNQKSLNPEF